MNTQSVFSLFVTAAPGTENIVNAEIKSLQNLSTLFRIEKSISGGIICRGNLPDIYMLNLHLRTAVRVLIKLANFHTADFATLMNKTEALPWELYLKPNEDAVIRVTSKKSKLYHTDGIAERIAESIGKRIGKTPNILTLDDIDKDKPAQVIITRIFDDYCTIRVDSSGENLHRRGYRLESAKAPLRESLAACMIFASGWQPGQILVDPFCGSGTIPIEAAMIANNIPSGINRNFRFQFWRNFDHDYWASMKTSAMPTDFPSEVRIFGSDRDEGAISAAQNNAKRAGVSDLVDFQHHSVSDLSPESEPGWIITNPPYGIRVSQNRDLRDLYAAFGNTLRKNLPDWRIALLSSDDYLIKQMRIKNFREILTFKNGPIPVAMHVAKV